MPSALQNETLAALQLMMRPIVRFLLRSGIGFREFSNVCKLVFARVATEDYGIRGRLTNISRVAVMTGLTRKEVKRIRKNNGHKAAVDLWSGKLNPPTEILHYWHTDTDFCNDDGSPKELPFSGDFPSFTDLVRRYSGDIPAGAMRVELKRSGSVVETDGAKLVAIKNYYTPVELDVEFIRSMAFSISNLSTTLVHNAKLSSQANLNEGEEEGRLERYVWTSGLSATDAQEFKIVAESKAAKLLDELDEWIGEREQAFRKQQIGKNGTMLLQERGYGLGIYFFERDKL